MGSSLYAREFTVEDLPGLAWSEWSIGTNIHHGLAVARQLPGRDRGANTQILMVTDGEPTAFGAFVLVDYVGGKRVCSSR